MSLSLYDTFLDDANFLSAFQHVRKKKSRGGIDKVSVDEFAKNLDKNLKQLQNQIAAGEYIPEPVQEVRQPKFNAQREFRKLGMPVVADKVVQTAFLKAVEPAAEKMFHNTSYAYRAGKGHRKAISRVEHNLNAWKAALGGASGCGQLL